MAIRLIKSLASRIGKRPSASNSSAASDKKASSSRPARARKAAPAKKVEGETWRPGQGKPSKGAIAKNKPQKQNTSGENKNDGSQGSESKKSDAPPRRRRRRPSRSNSGANSQSSDAQGRSEQKNDKAQVKAWSPDDYKVPAVDGKTRFHDVNLPEVLLRGVAELGFEYCTPIQARVLQEVDAGHNVAGQAQTGTGKTAAFLLLTFKQLLKNSASEDRPCGRPRALAIAPTRELVIQIARDAEAIGKHCDLRSVAVYGGTDYDKQERDLLQAPVDLIAATPGRLLDFQRKRKIDLRGVEVLIIDEADRMLDMGFIPDVRTIIRSTPPKDRRRTLLFSATLNDDVMRLASQWMPDPHVVQIEPDQVAVDTVRQLVYMVSTKEKFTVLYNLLNRPNIGRVLIFANRRDQTERIACELKRYGIRCELLSGAVNQNRRMRVLDDFRSGKVKTVVATDVAGRGLHVENIDHVVNFDLPYEAEDYVHRIGRTGRAGAEGTAVSFACEDESFTIPEIEKFIGEELSCLYPEEVLLAPLPHTDAPPYRRKPREGGGGNRGPRAGGGRRSGPPRRRR